MKVLKAKPTETTGQFRVRLRSEVISDLKNVTAEAEAAGLEFPVAEIVEAALLKAFKAARRELGSHLSTRLSTTADTDKTK